MFPFYILQLTSTCSIIQHAFNHRNDIISVILTLVSGCHVTFLVTINSSNPSARRSMSMVPFYITSSISWHGIIMISY